MLLTTCREMNKIWQGSPIRLDKFIRSLFYKFSIYFINFHIPHNDVDHAVIYRCIIYSNLQLQWFDNVHWLN